MSEALDDLIDADLFEELLDSDEVNLTAKVVSEMDDRASEYSRKMRRKQISDLGYRRLWDRALLTSSKRTVHSPGVISRFKTLAPGSRDPRSRMPRLRGDAVSSTLRAGTGRDHGSFTSCRPIHHKYDRVITVREAARLHGFPDWFRFHTTKWHGFRQVGNAVPPPLAEAVASEMVRALRMEPVRGQRILESGEPALLTYGPVDAAERMGMDPEELPPDVRRPRAAMRKTA